MRPNFLLIYLKKMNINKILVLAKAFTAVASLSKTNAQQPISHNLLNSNSSDLATQLIQQSGDQVLPGQEKFKEKPNEFDCTHLLLGSPKSKSTAVARALCHALQRLENNSSVSCIHEPFRTRHEMNEVGFKDKTIAYQSMPTTLCKDMLFNDLQPMNYEEMLLQAIKASPNAIVFLKSDLIQSFLSIVDLRFKEVQKRHPKLIPILGDKEQIDQFQTKVLTTISQTVVGNGINHIKIKNLASLYNKTVIELKEEAFANNATAELNKALASWDKELIPENQELKMAPALHLNSNLNSINPRVHKESVNSYQMAFTDTWGTTRGTVFDPSIGIQSQEEKLQTLMDQYVAVKAHSYFKSTMESYFRRIEESTTKAQSGYSTIQEKSQNIVSNKEHREL